MIYMLEWLNLYMDNDYFVVNNVISTTYLCWLINCVIGYITIVMPYTVENDINIG
jgi:hypothetical protein